MIEFVRIFQSITSAKRRPDALSILLVLASMIARKKAFVELSRNAESCLGKETVFV
jgi:hypothetical protein